MSISETNLVDCPNCEHPALMKSYASVNADRHSALRDEILEGRLLSETCTECGTTFRANPEFTYFDRGLGIWLNARPRGERAAWEDGEMNTQLTHLRIFGEGAPPAVVRIGAKLRARLTFGWPALVEKLLCSQHGLDDVTLELAKIAVVSGATDAIFVEDGELRVVAIDDEALTCAWLAGEPLEALSEVRIPRSLLAEIEAEPEPWSELRELVSSGFYVDMERALQV
ncbi:MAG: hypothetical protein H6741_08275 [Alphaproteobacteria bacterium]|nr:hypothetical protein [Alphaproteobacteria bacterium]MCB9792714.1 hypothetical protein [Alphaproteobacteria bacterium]